MTIIIKLDIEVEVVLLVTIIKYIHLEVLMEMNKMMIFYHLNNLLMMANTYLQIKLYLLMKNLQFIVKQKMKTKVLLVTR